MERTHADRELHLRRIRLHLARSKEYPQGSNRHGYEFVAPLNAEGRIDPEAWKAVRDRCRVHRFWGRENETGHLVHRPGGSWAFRYDDGDDEEAGLKFGTHAFEIGEYVSLRGADGDIHTFRVVSVDPV